MVTATFFHALTSSISKTCSTGQGRETCQYQAYPWSDLGLFLIMASYSCEVTNSPTWISFRYTIQQQKDAYIPLLAGSSLHHLDWHPQESVWHKHFREQLLKWSYNSCTHTQPSSWKKDSESVKSTGSPIWVNPGILVNCVDIGAAIAHVLKMRGFWCSPCLCIKSTRVNSHVVVEAHLSCSFQR